MLQKFKQLFLPNSSSLKNSLLHYCAVYCLMNMIFLFLKVNNIFLSIEMDRQDRYSQVQFQYDGDNLLSSLLNASSDHQQLIQIPQSINFKDIQPNSQRENQQQFIPEDYNDILNEDESNCMLPQNLNQESGQQFMLIITPSSKKTQAEIPLLGKKDYKIDKSAYKEQTRQIKIDRYLSKKSRRIWGRKVSYDCRKVVADKRQRLNGRFIKKSPTLTNKNDMLMTILANEQLQMLMDYQQSYKFSENNPFTLE